jgi:alkylation response protein AidB-like acyl-CoA dehydrogenase
MPWTDKQRALRDGLSRWGKPLSADHIQWDQRSEFPWGKWQVVRDSGVLRLPFPAQYGGLDQDLSTTMYVLEGLGNVCEDGGLSFSVATHIVSAGVPVLRFGTAEQKSRFLPRVCDGKAPCAHAITEPESGSDAFAMRTTAVRRGEDYVLNGSKAFITNGPVADLFVVYAMTDPAQGALGGSTAFLVERGTPGLSLGPSVPKMGLRTSPLGDLFFDDCLVPAGNVVGRPGMGFAILDYVMKWEILCSFIISVGEMQRRLEKCLAHAKARRQFGKPIGSFQSIANKLVDMRIGVDISREWLYRAARRMERQENVTVDLAIAKLLASEHNVASALNAVQIFGGAGYLVESGLEKELRNSIAGTIYSGTSEIQRNRIARMLGLEA